MERVVKQEEQVLMADKRIPADARRQAEFPFQTGLFWPTEATGRSKMGWIRSGKGFCMR